MKFYRFIKPYLTYQVGACVRFRNESKLVKEGYLEETTKEVYDEYLLSLKPKSVKPCEDCGGEPCEDCKSKEPVEVIEPVEVTAPVEVTEKPKKKAKNG